MSISGASYIAYSALIATQVQMTVASANISNADTQGYTEKTANQAAVYTGGAGAGVTVTSITGNVDKLLMKSLVGSTSDLGSADTLNNYLNQLQELYGNTTGNGSSGTSLGNTLASLESAISSLSNNPSDASLQANVVQALNTVASQLQQTSSGIQQVRGNVDQDISSSVADVNKQLQLIDSLNKQIAQANASGQPIGDLDDQRNTALQDIASKMDISYFTGANGALQIYTASGQSLVDSTAHTLSYTPAATVTASTAYNPGSSRGFGGIMLNGIDVTSQISSGSIGALVSLRDTVLPGAQSQLDQLADQLATSLNAVHNQGTSLPPPATLTGTAAVTSATPFSGTGTARIAVTDSKGNLVSYQDLDLSSYSNVGDLVSAINGTPGLSASIDPNGHVVITATGSGDGVAISEMSSSVGSNGQGLSDWLGLNNLVTASGASNFAVRGDILANPGLLAISSLDASASLTTGSQVLSPGSQTVAGSLYSTMTGETSFSSVAGLGATTTSFADYAADIVASVASKSSQASDSYTNKQALQSSFSSAMSSESGVNLDEETARLSSLQNEYTAAAELLQVVNQMFSALMSAVQTAVA